ncbi:MAG: LysM peptidoglycan-binding domain-containing protein [Clostridia bacterium]|jgi:hypothetical protein|nr:LysM peptidoglycan-binding domain-containing protein [Clostridia bacterium]
MKSKNIRRFITSILILAIIIFAIFRKPNDSNTFYQIETIYISKGDTLWSIAEQYKLRNQDIRDYIYEIRQLNNMQSVELHIDQELQIIIYEEGK